MADAARSAQLTANWPDTGLLVAAHGLAAGHPGVRSALGSPDWDRLMACVEHERLTGLLVEAIADGAIAATAGQAAAAARAHQGSMARAVLLEHTLLRVGAWFDASGIQYRVLKGTGVAHLDYPDPSLRSFGDVDLLVAPSQFDAAVELLLDAGHHRKYPEPRPGFDRRFGKGSCLVAPTGDELDLHRTLAMGPFGLTIDIDDLWATSARFRLAGREFEALGHDERFLHACFHVALGSTYPRLSALRDVAQMLHAGHRLDAAHIRSLSSRWGADSVVARAITSTWAILGLEPEGELVAWAMGYEPGKAERRALAVYLDAEPTYAAKSFAALRVIPGLRNKAAFLFGLACPRRDYLDQRQERALDRLRRGARTVLRSRRRWRAGRESR